MVLPQAAADPCDTESQDCATDLACATCILNTAADAAAAAESSPNDCSALIDALNGGDCNVAAYDTWVTCLDDYCGSSALNPSSLMAAAVIGAMLLMR